MNILQAFSINNCFNLHKIHFNIIMKDNQIKIHDFNYVKLVFLDIILQVSFS